MDVQNLSKLTGEELNEGKESFVFRKMCLNCKFVKENKDGELICGNQDNMQLAMTPVYEALKQVNGYSVTTLEVEPIPLKKPTNRCGMWGLNDEVVEYMKNLFS